jgi:hypothetical protein
MRTAAVKIRDAPMTDRIYLLLQLWMISLLLFVDGITAVVLHQQWFQ